jgi:outer membrane protein assembly factor BamD
MSRFLPLAVFCLLFALTACGGKDKDAMDAAGRPDQQVPVETMYNNAAAQLDKEEYYKAAKAFDEVDRQYPYSQWATRAQLMAGYAHYKNLKYDEAILALDRFIELHPGDDNVSYAYYMRALCYYEQISDVRRDQRMTQMALENLRQVKERFPDSKYAKDAQLKIDLTMDHLAGKEMEVGRYYLLRKQYQASIPRFQKVVDQYQTTTHVPEALHRLTEAYLSLGLIAEAQKTAAVLGHNYPHSSWYRDSYRLFKKDWQDPREAHEKSFYDRTIGKIF